MKKIENSERMALINIFYLILTMISFRNSAVFLDFLFTSIFGFFGVFTISMALAVITEIIIEKFENGNLKKLEGIKIIPGE